MVKKSETSQLLSDIKEGLGEKISGITKSVKEASRAVKEEKKSREELKIAKAGYAEGRRKRLTELEEEAKIKALLEFRAKQQLQQQYQQQIATQPQIISQSQIQLPRRKTFEEKMFSFTNRPFMETNPFIGDNPFFPRRRRPL